MSNKVKNRIEMMDTSTKGMDGYSAGKYLNIARLNNHIFKLEQRVCQLENQIRKIKQEK
mgnify:CR=1 FL=1